MKYRLTFTKKNNACECVMEKKDKIKNRVCVCGTKSLVCHAKQLKQE